MVDPSHALQAFGNGPRAWLRLWRAYLWIVSGGPPLQPPRVQTSEVNLACHTHQERTGEAWRSRLGVISWRGATYSSETTSLRLMREASK